MTYVVASAADFDAMTTDDFKKYKAIVFADPANCYEGVLEGALRSRYSWSAAVEGNIVLIGADEVYHWNNGGRELATSALSFVADDPGKTGLYMSLSCYYSRENAVRGIELLVDFGFIAVVGIYDGYCINDVHIVADHPATASLDDAILSDWSCSAYEVFLQFPDSFYPLAITRNYGNSPHADGSVGYPYILVRGDSVVPIGPSCGDGILTAVEQCDDGNTVSGDGCSSTCQFEECVPVRNCKDDCNTVCDFFGVTYVHPEQCHKVDVINTRALIGGTGSKRQKCCSCKE